MYMRWQNQPPPPFGGGQPTLRQPNTPSQDEQMVTTASDRLDYLNARIEEQALHLSELHERLLEVVKLRRLATQAFTETSEFKEYQHNENYLIDRCAAAKYELEQRVKERSQYLAEILNINPDTDTPLLSAND